MYYTFSKSSIGYNHIKNHLPCQDSSFEFRNNNFIALGCCDGHGGDKYVRSKRGSEFACEALLTIFKKVSKLSQTKLQDQAYLDQIKLDILCEWNRLCSNDLKANHLRKNELQKLDEKDIKSLRQNPIRAYGTTLSGAMLIKDILIVVSIGDSEPILVKKGDFCTVFDSNCAPVANITYSMCQEDAYNCMNIKAIRFSDYDGLLLMTDGLSSPYQNYVNFKDNFILPMMGKFVCEHNQVFIEKFIDKLGNEIGVGDDVSLACIINSRSPKKYYQNK